ncbi:MAG: 3-deoxy-manno-octulosonate cytidylyltransferase [Salinisphaera sp.]|nr:3-deoxy-manno-octulosonate cytidylyltransferase [Salinisphaera sp.]
MSFRVVIPARYAATRLPGKPLRELAGEPMLVHVLRRAQESGAGEVWVATDDQRIAAVAQGHGAAVQMTSRAHQSGTDRLAEVVQRQDWADDDIVVNLQGDEPLMPGALIAQVAGAVTADSDIATACVPIETLAEYRDPQVVKLVCDGAGNALYFSRAPIPHRRDGHGLPDAGAWRHLGLYAYRVAALKRFAAAQPTGLEQSEKLEQLRALGMGMRIVVVRAAVAPGPGVDTEADLARAASLLQEGQAQRE